MSAEAIAFVWKYGPASGLKGNDLLAMLFLASRSKSRALPFMSEASFRELADHLTVSERYAKSIIKGLRESEHIGRTIEGRGGAPNLYQFGRRGVIYSSLRGVIHRSPLFGGLSEEA